MGTWGPGIFDDDLASDVKDAYMALLSGGMTGPQATESLLADWTEALDDADDGPVFWLALAATQWELGRLEPHVKKRALQLIREGQCLERWADDPAKHAGRERALHELAKKLGSRPPARKSIPPQSLPEFTALRPGQIFAYRLLSGSWTLMKLSDLWRAADGQYAAVQLLDWTGAAPPEASAAITMPDRFYPSSQPVKFSLYEKRRGDFPADRVIVVAQGMPDPRGAEGSILSHWRELDEKLTALNLH